MSEYQVIARKYRPKQFNDVLGQEVIVTSLKNAIKYHRVPQALLLCGPAGSGKTTLARLFSKALNCIHPGADQEPCNACASCHEIAGGVSIDVIEIDGASNRGIDDMRKINETAGYAPTYRYKIYIIDEVHMLTKEAFNALLKTLEEPPPNVLFIFATTEPQKIPSTIISRCQRYSLNRISSPLIVQKLSQITKEQGYFAQPEALLLLARLAEGGLRDAESLLDQIMAFQSETITVDVVTSILGIVSKETFFELDEAGKQNNLSKAFEIVEKVFKEGKNLNHFTESLLTHFRTLLLVALGGKEASSLTLSEEELKRYLSAAKYYTREQCVWIIDMLLEAQIQIRQAPSKRFFLEALLMRIIRSHCHLPLPVIIERLSELEKKITDPQVQITQIREDAQIAEIKKEVNKEITVEKIETQEQVQQEIKNKILEKKTPEMEIKKDKLAVNERAKQAQLDTKLQFAATLLEGTVIKTRG